MGQVPEDKNLIIIGNGRLAKHWIQYLTLLQTPFTHWYRKQNTSLRLQPNDIVFLAIQDAAIPQFVMQHPDISRATAVHFSGANYYEGLLGMHPLMTFAGDLYDLETYHNIPLAIDFPKSTFEQYFSFLKNPTWQIQGKDRAKYHALCVMSGNFPQILWQKVESEIKALGCPVPGWKRYILQSAINFSKNSDSLSGPLTRKDHITIEKNLSSLTESNLKEIYLAFCKLYEIEVNHENH